MTKLEEKSPEILTIMVNGEERDIFMSYGLLNTLVKLIGEMDRVPLVYLDGDLRDAVMKTVLAERTKSGKVVKEIEDLDEFEISFTSAENLLEWVSEHVTGFFLRSLLKVGNMSKKHQTSLEQLASSLPGSQA